MKLSTPTLINYLRQYTALIISLFIMTFGVSLSIRTNLGSSAISVWPYAWSLARQPFTIMGTTFQVPAWSLGEYTYCMNFLLVFVQVVLLRRRFAPIQFAQLLLGFLFGSFLDLTMWMTAPLQWDTTVWGYVASVVQLFVGGLILAFGITCEVRCKALMMPGEGFPVALAQVTGKDFGKIKIFTDTGLVLTGVLFCYLFFGQWRWDIVGAGTLFSMIYVGIAVRMLSPRTQWLSNYLFGTSASATPCTSSETSSVSSSDSASFPWVITLAREYGSGGHEIGQKLAQRLGIDFCDHRVVEETAHTLGLSTEQVERTEQRVSNSKLLEYILTDHQVPENLALSQSEKLFVTQSQVIRKMAANQSCVIIGRCADYILKDRPNVLRIFVYADATFAVKRIAKEKQISSEAAEELINHTNRERSNHYWQFTDRKWNSPAHYDLMVCSSSLGIEGSVDLIYSLYKKLQG